MTGNLVNRPVVLVARPKGVPGAEHFAVESVAVPELPDATFLIEAASQLAAWVRAGSLAYREHVLDGAEAARDAIAMLYAGRNTGKLIVRVD